MDLCRRGAPREVHQREHEKPSKIPPLEQLAMGSAADVTREQFLLLLFQQGEGAGVVPLQVLAVLGLMLLCQGGTLDLVPIVGWSHLWLWVPWWLGFWVSWWCRKFLCPGRQRGAEALPTSFPSASTCPQGPSLLNSMWMKSWIHLSLSQG